MPDFYNSATIMQKYLLVLLLISYFASGQTKNDAVLAKDFKAQKKWVNKQLKSMSLEEKIGQLFMVAAFTKDELDNRQNIKNQIQEYHLGGVIFSKGNPYKQAQFTNEIQKKSDIPLLIGMDAEWGLSMRLDSTFAFPYNLTLGAIKDHHLIYDIGKQIGTHNKRLGVHINFAPVVDINTNPKNPIIGNRSFGESKLNVTQKSLAFMKGMQEAGVLACAKHFPGHGDTDADSHKTLPTVNFSKSRIEEVDLYPYTQLIDKGLNAVMVAHLNIPSMTGVKGLPTTLSNQVIQQKLKSDFNFSGLIFSDAMNMKGVTNYNSDQPSVVKAFQAGNDVLLIPDDLPENFNQLKTAVDKGDISMRRLNYSVRKILYVKYKLGLDDIQPIDFQNLTKDLNSQKNKSLTYKAYASAATLVKNDLGLIPFQSVQKRTALLALGDGDYDIFYEELSNYQSIDRITKEDVNNQTDIFDSYDRLIISHHKDTSSPWNDNSISVSDKQVISKAVANTSVVLVNFTSPYALSNLPSTLSINAILNLYQNHPIAQKVAASIIYGARSSKGKLPVSISRAFPEGSGFRSKNLKRLYYDMPSNSGFSLQKLSKVDSMIKKSIKDKQIPGAQVLIAKDRSIIYQKNFGHYRYEGNQSVTDTTLYDIASLTKIMATLPVIMHMYERNKIDIDDTLGELLPAYQSTNKADISIKRMLSHYARLQAWIPFYQSTLENRDNYYRETASDSFSIQLTDKLYLRSDYRDSIQHQIIESPLNDSLYYDYSDLPFYILKDYIEQEYEPSLDELVQDLFYESLGNTRMLYKPLNKFDQSVIAPSYMDKNWRKTEIQGVVQDQGAAMLGGVGGHAGVFANAKNVAKMMQLYINGGTYGGKRYLNQSTINFFNTCHYCEKEVRRGLGFDKPQLDDIGPTCGCVSMTSFGHSGFTGAYTWADPSENLIFVFLTNRTYPDMDNDKLIKENTRTEIQRLIYKALED